MTSRWRPVPAVPHPSNRVRKCYVDGRPVTIIDQDDEGYDYRFDDDPRGGYDANVWVNA